ncbi:6269_t:CDS:2, partial [Racocetra fulgida]
LELWLLSPVSQLTEDTVKNGKKLVSNRKLPLDDVQENDQRRLKDDKESIPNLEKKLPTIYLKHAENDNPDKKHGLELYQQNGTGTEKDDCKPLTYCENIPDDETGDKSDRET